MRAKRERTTAAAAAAPSTPGLASAGNSMSKYRWTGRLKSLSGWGERRVSWVVPSHHSGNQENLP